MVCQFLCYAVIIPVREKCCLRMSSAPTGGWSAEDHDVFLYVMDSYTYDLANRRLLYIDCLLHWLPLKTRADIVSCLLCSENGAVFVMKSNIIKI